MNSIVMSATCVVCGKNGTTTQTALEEAGGTTFCSERCQRTYKSNQEQLLKNLSDLKTEVDLLDHPANWTLISGEITRRGLKTPSAAQLFDCYLAVRPQLLKKLSQADVDRMTSKELMQTIRNYGEDFFNEMLKEQNITQHGLDRSAGMVHFHFGGIRA